MWDDYSFIREGAPPRSAYGPGNPLGVIQFSPATVQDSASVGTLIGYLSVVGGTGLYAFSMVNNLYFTLLGNQVRVKGPLKPGSFAVSISAQSSAGRIDQSFIITVIGTSGFILLADGTSQLLQTDGSNVLTAGS